VTPVDLIAQWADDQGYSVKIVGGGVGDFIDVWGQGFPPYKYRVRFEVINERKSRFIRDFYNGRVDPLTVRVSTKIPFTLNLADPRFFDKLGERLRYEWDVVLGDACRSS
jgi:hypothetical protein